MPEEHLVAQATVHKGRLWKIFWPFAKFLYGIVWLKRLSDRARFVPVAFTIVVIWAILRLSNFSFMRSWIAAFVLALVMAFGLLLEARQCTSARFSFNKILYDQLFAILAVKLATAVFVLLLVYHKGLCPGDVFIFLLYTIDAEFGPYIYLRTNFRSFVGTGIGGGDEQSVHLDVGDVDHHM